MHEFAIALANQAGEVLLRMQRAGETRLVATKKSQIDLQTEADLASESLILGALRGQYPAHAVYAEESAQGAPPDAEWLWVIDPVDGTTNYAHGLPLFGVNMALVHAGEPVLGVTHLPALRQTYWAAKGAGAWLREAGQDRPIHVSGPESLQGSLVATGFPYDRATERDNNMAEFLALESRVRGVRRLGSASLPMAWAAAGILDGYWEARAQPWDWAAGDVLVREAGGVVSDYAGRPWQLRSRAVICGSREFVGVLLAEISSARAQAGLGDL